VKFKSKTELTNWALGSQRLWLFLDYDGTLADFAPTPDHIEPDRRVIAVLQQLDSNPDIRITILSGRRLEHIRRLLPIPEIFLVGTYGIELLTPVGEIIHRVDYRKIRPPLERLIPIWANTIAGRDGFYLEDKGWALALHARAADDVEAEQVLTRARQATMETSATEYFRILGGHKFLEIAPAVAGKGNTISYLLSQYPVPNARLLGIGDDDKDEEAFHIIHARGGVAVKVIQPSQASSPTDADFFFESPVETIDWLEGLNWSHSRP
jgi:trehalose-phosphatase